MTNNECPRVALEDRISGALQERRDKSLLRELKNYRNGVDFLSNDYLGIARNWIAKRDLNKFGMEAAGSTGSRLVSGNYEAIEELEDRIARVHRAQAALLFNSGYDANIGLFSSIVGRHDTVIYDALCHASIRDGIALSNARSFAFRHNDIDDLRTKLRSSTGTVVVAVESIYSMDGDEAPLAQIAAIAEGERATLVVDEAHSGGIYGDNGEGLVCALGLSNMVPIRVHTFGKAFGVHGAAVVCSERLRKFLVNFARSFIYTTAPSPDAVKNIDIAYDFVSAAKNERQRLSDLVQLSSALRKEHDYLRFSGPPTHIQGLLANGNGNARKLAEVCRAHGFQVKEILSPTVPSGQERIRMSLHSFNTENELRAIFDIFAKELK